MRETKFGLPQTFCAKDWTLSWAQPLSFDFGGFDDLCKVNCRIAELMQLIAIVIAIGAKILFFLKYYVILCVCTKLLTEE